MIFYDSRLESINAASCIKNVSRIATIRTPLDSHKKVRTNQVDRELGTELMRCFTCHSFETSLPSLPSVRILSEPSRRATKNQPTTKVTNPLRSKTIRRLKMKPHQRSNHVFCAFAIAAMTFVGCSKDGTYPTRPITIVCPWGAGGGTDNISREMAAHLKSELGMPVNVMNATGGQGVAGHSRGLLARPDGYTITMMTLELNMLHWRGLTDLTWQSSEPLMSLNEDPAAIFVRADSTELKTILDVAAAVKANPGKLRASGTASLAAWHLALAGWLISIGQTPTDIVWIPSQGASPSLLELISGDIDLVCCSVPEAESLIAAGEVRCLGVMADQRLATEKFKMHPTLKEQGSDWTLTGWRALGLPKGTPEPIRQRLLEAVTKIVTGKTQVNGQTFPGFMDLRGFDRTWRSQANLTGFLSDNDKDLGNILQSDAFKSIKGGPVGPMAFPWVAFTLFAFSSVGIAAQVLIGRKNRTHGTHDAESMGQPATESIAKPEPVIVKPEAATLPAETHWGLFALIVVSVLGFMFVAETVGFILTAAVLLAGLCISLGTRPTHAIAVAVLVSPLIYELFSGFLSVPLPIGWLGW